MTKAQDTRTRLLTEARRLLWSRGYSNVPLREIAQGAGVDVALVARYFGSKRGLFEAPLDGAFDVRDARDEADLVDMVLTMYRDAPRDVATPSILQLMQSCANDPDVGGMVRQAQISGMQSKLDALLGSPARAALFMSVLLGFALAEKTLKLPGIPAPGTPAFDAQLRHLMESALRYDGP